MNAPLFWHQAANSMHWTNKPGGSSSSSGGGGGFGFSTLQSCCKTHNLQLFKRALVSPHRSKTTERRDWTSTQFHIHCSSMCLCVCVWKRSELRCFSQTCMSIQTRTAPKAAKGHFAKVRKTFRSDIQRERARGCTVVYRNIVSEAETLAKGAATANIVNI